MNKWKITLTVFAFSIIFASPAISEKTRGKTNDQPNNEISFEQTRTITLDQFGIRMEIPKDYRAMLRNNGTVQIVRPETYQTIRCNSSEYSVCYGSGYKSLKIKRLPNSKDTLLHEKVGKLISNNECFPRLTPFKFEGLKGLIGKTKSGCFPSAKAWFMVPDLGIIQMSLGDGPPEIMKEELQKYLRHLDYIK